MKKLSDYHRARKIARSRDGQHHRDAAGTAYAANDLHNPHRDILGSHGQFDRVKGQWRKSNSQFAGR